MADAHDEYWRECVAIALDEAGVTATAEQIKEIAWAVRGGHENIDLAFYVPENPLKSENERLSRKLKWERDLVGCGECGGRGRLEYYTGPWAVNTKCHACHGGGKVHPRGEREPA